MFRKEDLNTSATLLKHVLIMCAGMEQFVIVSRKR